MLTPDMQMTARSALQPKLGFGLQTPVSICPLTSSPRALHQYHRLKAPSAAVTKQHEHIILVRVLEIRTGLVWLKLRCHQGCVPLEGSRGECCLAFSSSQMLSTFLGSGPLPPSPGHLLGHPSVSHTDPSSAFKGLVLTSGPPG